MKRHVLLSHVTQRLAEIKVFPTTTTTTTKSTALNVFSVFEFKRAPPVYYLHFKCRTFGFDFVLFADL